MNGIRWDVIFVPSDSLILIDRTKQHTVATTDPYDHNIYINQNINAKALIHVLLHELGHCVMVSYGLLNEIHEMVKPEYYIRAEEWVCNIIADHAFEILKIVKDLQLVPRYLDKLYSFRGDYDN